MTEDDMNIIDQFNLTKGEAKRIAIQKGEDLDSITNPDVLFNSLSERIEELEKQVKKIIDWIEISEKP